MTDAPTPPLIPPQTQPLSDDALKATDILSRMRAEAALRGSTMVVPPKRGPGRPRKTESFKPPTTPKPPPDQTGPTLEEIRVAKKQRTDELRATILTSINDNLVMLINSMGVPSDLLYKEGMAPSEVDSDKFTPIAHKITVSDLQAGLYARFITEAEGTDIGKKASGLTGNGTAPLVIYGILSAATTFMYVKNVIDFFQQIQPLIETYQAAQNIRLAEERARTSQDSQ